MNKVVTSYGVFIEINCSITPVSPTMLNATGGVLAVGTQNVTLDCNCFIGSTRTDGTGWFFTNSTGTYQVRVPTDVEYEPGSPYYLNTNAADPVTLVIPAFHVPYNGTYTCVPSIVNPPTVPPGARISLSVTGKINCLVFV